MPEREGGGPPAAPLRMHALAYGLGVTAAVSAAVRLGIADALGQEPKPVAELAAEVGADGSALRQLLRALSVRDVFRDAGDDRYAHTEMSRLLRAGEPGGKRDMVLLASAPFAWRIWASLEETVRTGESAFPRLYGKTLFEHLAEDDPEAGAIFDRAMAGSGALVGKAIASTLELSGVDHLVDVGGGYGHTLKAVLEQHPGLRGTLFDLPRVTGDADPQLRPGGALADRCAIVAGDATEAMPVAADLYLLKHVVHMWDDDTAVRALRVIAENAPAGAKVVLAEQLLDAGPAPEVTTMMGLLMLVSQGGRERTGGELRALIERAGLRFLGITPTGTQVHLVETVVDRD